MNSLPQEQLLPLMLDTTPGRYAILSLPVTHVKVSRSGVELLSGWQIENSFDLTRGLARVEEIRSAGGVAMLILILE